MKDALADRIGQRLLSLPINQVYAATQIFILLKLSYWDDYKNWSEIPDWNKWLAASSLFASIVMILICIGLFLNSIFSGVDPFVE